MKYILAVGIIFQKYKKPMEVTIQSKKFIDSFEIENKTIVHRCCVDKSGMEVGFRG